MDVEGMKNLLIFWPDGYIIFISNLLLVDPKSY